MAFPSNSTYLAQILAGYHVVAKPLSASAASSITLKKDTTTDIIGAASAAIISELR